MPKIFQHADQLTVKAMRTYFICLAALAMLTCAASCSHRKESHGAYLDLSVSNAMTATYWVWSDSPVVNVGVLSPGVSATYIDAGQPSIDVVTLDLVADTDRRHRTSIKVNIAPLRQLSLGHHEAVISLISENQAKLYIDGHEK
jgi:hypothetical protein